MAEDYKIISQYENFLQNPSIVIGNINKCKKRSTILKDEKFKYNLINFRECIIKMFDEILSNALDSYFNNKTKKIEIKIKPKKIEIINYGNVELISLKKDKDNNYWITNLFSKLNSSSNYNKDRKGVGVFGLGSKVVNLFSYEFEVEVKNKHELFKQKWIEFKTKYITHTEIDKSFEEDYKYYVKVSFTPKNLSEDDILNEYPYFDLFLKRCIDSSLFIQNIFFNKTKLNYTFDDYCKLYTDLKAFYEYNDENLNYKFYNSDSNNRSTLIINGMTIDNGNNIIKDIIFDKIIKKYNSNKIKMKNITNNIFCIIKLKNNNLIFNDLLKQKLSTNSLFDLPKEFYIKLKELNIFETIINDNKNEERKEKLKKISLKDIIKFNETTNKNTKNAYLIITEGDSARNSVMCGIYNQRHLYAVFGIKGKFTNITNNNLSENLELNQLSSIIGLNTPRYKGIIIMTDQDYDGFHIRCLIINFITSKFIKYFNTIKIYIFRTPIITVKKKNKFHSEYFSINDFNNCSNTLKGCEIFYNKGIGSHEKDQMIKFFKPENIDKYLILIENPKENDIEYLNDVFDKNKTFERKKWMSTKMNYIELKESTCIKSIIDNELHQYSLYSIERAIPSIIDGLKVSQRKSIFYAIIHNLYTPTKLVNLASDITKLYEYNHSSESLLLAIKELAREHTNNLPLFYGIGSYGNFRDNKGASPRYLKIQLHEYTKHIYNLLDNKHLEKRISDNVEVEPYFLIPIIPMILINNNKGIATGWKSEFPCFNPIDIIDIYLNKNESNIENINILPWYRNNLSYIFIKNNSDNNYLIHNNYKIIFVSKIYKNKNNKNKYLVTSLPRYLTIDKYRTSLNKLFIEKKIKYDEVSKDHPYIIIEILEENNMNICDVLNYLHLYEIFTPNYYSCYISKNTNKIKEYTIFETLNKFSKTRLKLYKIRKNIILNNLNVNLTLKKATYNFIKLKLSNKLIIENKTQNEIILNLKTLNFKDIHNDEYKYFLNLPLRSLTFEKVKKLSDEIKKIKNDINEISNITEREMWHKELIELKDKLININYGHSFKESYVDDKEWTLIKLNI